MRSSTRRRLWLTAGATGLAAATLVAFGSFAWAEPEAAGVIRACVNTRNGDVRIVEAPRDGGGYGCGRFERSVTWNVTGPRGPQGPRGAQGPRGQQGPAGPAAAPVGFSVGPITGDMPPDRTLIASIEDLPAGTYQATASISVRQRGESPAYDCVLEGGTLGNAMAFTDPRPGIDNLPFTASGATVAQFTLPANSDITLTCAGLGEYYAAINAIAVTPAA